VWRLPADSPAVVYHDPTAGKCRLITASQVTIFLHHIEHKVFNIPTGHKDLLAWSCHSIHVTAANLLHCAWFSNSLKKDHLRWCSDSFLMYLRNTHTKAITLGLDLPNCSIA
jgi:hypothetical protein